MNFDEIAGFDYIVIGDPVEHSVSPPMQNPAFEQLGMGSPYGRLRVSPQDMEEFTRYARKNLKGFNITVPDKPAVIPFLDEISPEAKAANSVNTVTVKDGRLIGTSTDGYGLETALNEAFDFSVKQGKICFIGCGGAVQAVAFHFAAAGVSELMFINRTVSKAQELCDRVTAAYGTQCRCCGLNDTSVIKDFIAVSGVIIQGTSVGLKPEAPCPIPEELLSGDICCYDTIYKNTAFLQAATQNGLRIADGRTMLLHQGAKSFEIWTGQKPDIDAMRQGLYQALNSK